LKLKPEHKIALAISVPIIAIGTYLIVSKVSALTKKYLMISAGEGGTTDPPPGTHTYNVGETVTIKAIPNEGYTVGTWVVDGIKVAEQVEEYTITMDINHTVVVTFWEGGQPPATYPASIVPLGSISITSNIGVRGGGWGAHISYHYCDENWNADKYVKVPIRFQVQDAAGRGVPNIDVALWANIPDGSKYAGIVLLDGEPHPQEHPLVKKTDADGVVSADVSYVYGLNDRFKAICADAGIGCWTYTPPFYVYQWKCPNACYDCCQFPSWAYVYGQFGEGESGKNLPPPYMNEIFAQVVGTTLVTKEFSRCGFHIKWI